jgi:hypothetical protein
VASPRPLGWLCFVGLRFILFYFIFDFLGVSLLVDARMRRSLFAPSSLVLCATFRSTPPLRPAVPPLSSPPESTILTFTPHPTYPRPSPRPPPRLSLGRALCRCRRVILDPSPVSCFLAFHNCHLIIHLFDSHAFAPYVEAAAATDVYIDTRQGPSSSGALTSTPPPLAM